MDAYRAAAGIPSGAILLWSGSIVSIPAGFVLCDGNNSTPDLTDQFVVGAGDGYAVDATGGSGSHQHTFTADPHSHGSYGAPVLQAGTDHSKNEYIKASEGTTDYTNGKPPYYALAYIMKT